MLLVGNAGKGMVVLVPSASFSVISDPRTRAVVSVAAEGLVLLEGELAAPHAQLHPGRVAGFLLPHVTVVFVKSISLGHFSCAGGSHCCRYGEILLKKQISANAVLKQHSSSRHPPAVFRFLPTHWLNLGRGALT